MATDHDDQHGRDILWTLRAKGAPEQIKQAWIGTSWILELTTSASRNGRRFHATQLLITSLRTTPKALLHLVRDRWSIESWHWIRDTQFHEDKYLYKGNNAGVMGCLRTAGMNLLRFDGFQSIHAGMQAVTHKISALLAMALRKPETETS